MRIAKRGTLWIVESGLALIVPAILGAQARVIKVVSTDGQPVAYANVSVEGGLTQITDEKGNVSLGAGGHQTLTLNIRRIGFTPWFGKLELPGTAAVLTVTLHRLAQTLSPVTVNGTEIKSPLALTGFYDRWLMRQKGVLSAVFIGPEELEFRHPDKITNMLYGLNGVHVSRACVMPGDRRTCVLGLVAFAGQSCPMTVVIDGQQQYPPKGADVDINMLLDAGDVAAIEVYARGGNMPVNFQFQDTACGVVAFWTGSRRP
ncbi:MAG: hypothetical protein ACHQSE_12640 [Gemmatimonadales bacterium]